MHYFSCSSTMLAATVAWVTFSINWIVLWRPLRPASLSLASVTLWLSCLECWLATLSVLSVQVLVPLRKGGMWQPNRPATLSLVGLTLCPSWLWVCYQSRFASQWGCCYWDVTVLNDPGRYCGKDDNNPSSALIRIHIVDYFTLYLRSIVSSSKLPRKRTLWIPLQLQQLFPPRGSVLHPAGRQMLIASA